jgi:hypothetical protein
MGKNKKEQLAAAEVVQGAVEGTRGTDGTDATGETVEATGKVRVVVESEFTDKFDNSVTYRPGTVLEFDAERANDVVSRGLAKFANEKKESTKTEEGGSNGVEV